ncbi:LPS biosynthesis protein [Cellulomonas chitinilytica]|uniref:LPS biosynthesis protein n=1 Tax=Cellulomonas chitinilytica TaxID=398759 RepID=A0A919P9W4_9CELL|nr:acyltransferase [Cellulomonas chitinilytica]GIG23549.1 LPS biosynthesis protein [Cellulomonas chitinilytica]
MVATERAPVVEHTPSGTGPGVPAENGAINLVRVLAALAVVVSHAKTLLFVDWEETDQSLPVRAVYAMSSLGHQAVVVFFVLSGFWVGGAVVSRARAHRFSAAGYLTDRVTRLWVVLIPALVLTAALDTIGRRLYADAAPYVGDARYAGLIRAPHPIDGVTFLGNAGFVANIHVPTYGSNGALWSLGYEFWMYVVGAAVVLLVLSRQRSRWWFVLAVAVVGAVVLKPAVLIYVPVWLAGALVAAIAGPIREWLARRTTVELVAVRGGAVLATVGTAVAVRLGSPPTWLGDYALTVPTAVLIATLVTGWRRAESSPLGRVAGLASCSYSLYAIHLPVLVLATAALGVEVEARWHPDVPHLLALAVILAAVTVVAWVFARGTEHHTPAVRRLARRVLRTP